MRLHIFWKADSASRGDAVKANSFLRQMSLGMPLWHFVLNTRPAWLETSLLTSSAALSSLAIRGRATAVA